ncbi:hypothetical protein mRhiFer1_009771 [Rhinolophus ferrumequinum]|uniref:Uncharacterized protein n=1 Tax=Rhinolophus ferrumequinum TaxID=59479 RepID=A0A7J7ZCP8_RHIFE|nr:hypothetical protein mRhiFer1_009771 [Rhinolophus ferrumequinum]
MAPACWLHGRRAPYREKGDSSSSPTLKLHKSVSPHMSLMVSESPSLHWSQGSPNGLRHLVSFSVPSTESRGLLPFPGIPLSLLCSVITTTTTITITTATTTTTIIAIITTTATNTATHTIIITIIATTTTTITIITINTHASLNLLQLQC